MWTSSPRPLHVRLCLHGCSRPVSGCCPFSFCFIYSAAAASHAFICKILTFAFQKKHGFWRLLTRYFLEIILIVSFRSVSHGHKRTGGIASKRQKQQKKPSLWKKKASTNPRSLITGLVAGFQYFLGLITVSAVRHFGTRWLLFLFYDHFLFFTNKRRKPRLV